MSAHRQPTGYPLPMRKHTQPSRPSMMALGQKERTIYQKSRREAGRLQSAAVSRQYTAPPWGHKIFRKAGEANG